MSAGTFTLSGNRVTNNHCSSALAVCCGSRAQVVVDGGYYSTAENSHETHGALYVESGNSPRSSRVLLKGGVVFDYLGRQRRLRDRRQWQRPSSSRRFGAREQLPRSLCRDESVHGSLRHSRRLAPSSGARRASHPECL
jgi:hypothetical protein